MPRFHVSRSIDIDASPESVFAVVSDFDTWKTWSPWLIAEPDAQVTVSDDAKSIGSTYAWEGQVTGAGEMTHLRLEAPEHVVSEIRFLRPMKFGYATTESGPVPDGLSEWSAPASSAFHVEHVGSYEHLGNATRQFAAGSVPRNR